MSSDERNERHECVVDMYSGSFTPSHLHQGVHNSAVHIQSPRLKSIEAKLRMQTPDTNIEFGRKYAERRRLDPHADR